MERGTDSQSMRPSWVGKKKNGTLISDQFSYYTYFRTHYIATSQLKNIDLKFYTVR